MDGQELSQQLHDLQIRMKDGDDLARAIGLIGDALERRMEGIRECLEELSEEDDIPERARLQDVVDRVVETLDNYEDKLEERRQRMEEMVDEFQSSLGEEAAALHELEVEFGDGGQA